MESIDFYFALNLLSYLFHQHGFTSTWELSSPKSSENFKHYFTEDIGKAILLLSYTFRPIFGRKILKVLTESDSITNVEKLRLYVLKFSSRPYNSEMYFVEFLITCSFMSELMIILASKSKHNFLAHIPLYLFETLEKHVLKDFYNRGGYEKLQSNSFIFARAYEKLESLISKETPRCKLIPTKMLFQTLFDQNISDCKKERIVVKLGLAKPLTKSCTELIEEFENNLISILKLFDVYQEKEIPSSKISENYTINKSSKEDDEKRHVENKDSKMIEKLVCGRLENVEQNVSPEFYADADGTNDKVKNAVSEVFYENTLYSYTERVIAKLKNLKYDLSVLKEKVKSFKNFKEKVLTKLQDLEDNFSFLKENVELCENMRRQTHIFIRKTHNVSDVSLIRKTLFKVFNENILDSSNENILEVHAEAEKRHYKHKSLQSEVQEGKRLLPNLKI